MSENKTLSENNQPPQTLLPETIINGILHIFVAFDWGDEVDLIKAKKLVSAEAFALRRRRRTPMSIEYRPLPLRLQLPSTPISFPPLGEFEATAEATVFDFGAMSIALRLPFCLTAQKLSQLAGQLADPSALVERARHMSLPLFQSLMPAIDTPHLSELTEEYFIFEIPPTPELPSPAKILEHNASWLAGLVSLETGSLSKEEVSHSTTKHLTYSPNDLLIADWAAAVLLDRDCEETLQIMEFANLQLLELRHIDMRLDDILNEAYRNIKPVRRSWLLWRPHMQPLRMLGELKVEANGLFERTGNAIKLVGDQYLARAYRLLAGRFHLESWGQNIGRKLETVEGVYQVLSNQASTARLELLEVVIILLIAGEIIMSFLQRITSQ